MHIKSSNILLLILPAMLILSSCNGGSTNNTYITGCQLPTFTPQIGNFLLNQWGQSVQQYSTSAQNAGDVYVRAGYFTMSNYTPDAILLPTVSSVQREGTQEIYDYFTHFLALKPVMSLPNTESNVFEAISCGFGSGNGYYDFLTTDPITQAQSTVHARFTFIYKYESTPFSEAFIVESGSSAKQVKMQTNPPGWYVWTQNSAVVPGGH